MTALSMKNVEDFLMGDIIENDITYILVDYNREYPNLIAIFSTYFDAYKYMVRTSINYCGDNYTDDTDDLTDKEYTEHVKDYIRDFMKIFPVNHIDISKPIYEIIGSEVNGNLTDYITNSIDFWKRQMTHYGMSRLVDKCKEFQLEVDPSLPELKYVDSRDEE